MSEETTVPEKIRKYLENNEKIRWSGQPSLKPGIVKIAGIGVLIVPMLFVLKNQLPGVFWPFLILAAIAFALLAAAYVLYVKRIFFIVTNRRIIFIRGIFASAVQTLYFQNVVDLRLEISPLSRLLGVGNLTFDVPTHKSGRQRRNSPVPEFRFFDVPEPEKALNIVQKTVRKKTRDTYYPNNKRNRRSK